MSRDGTKVTILTVTDSAHWYNFVPVERQLVGVGHYQIIAFMKFLTPVYPYYSAEIPSADNSALFHYTKFENFLKIIETMKLCSSPLSRMNDLNEANLDSLDWNSDFMLMYNAETYVKEECSVISFTSNFLLSSSSFEEGSNHPAMWAHYAEKSSGVCIVLDKDALIENNLHQLNKVFYKIESVEYCLCCAPDDGITQKNYTDVSDFVRQNYRELFFKKHSDWSYEREQRFFVEASEFKLNIKGAIKYIVLGRKLVEDEKRLMRLNQQLSTPGMESFGYLKPISFAEVQPTVNGYMTVQSYVM